MQRLDLDESICLKEDRTEVNTDMERVMGVIARVRAAGLGHLPILPLEHYDAADRVGLCVVVKPLRVGQRDDGGRTLHADGYAIAVVPYSGNERETRREIVEQIAAHVMTDEAQNSRSDELSLLFVGLTPRDVLRIAHLASQLIEEEIDKESRDAGRSD